MKNKKKKTLAKSKVLREKTATTGKGPEASCSRPRKSSDFDAELANLRARTSGKKCQKGVLGKQILLAQPTFVAPSVQGEEAEKEASKARQERMNILLGDEGGRSQHEDIIIRSTKQQQGPKNRFFGLDVDGEILPDEGARVSLTPGILSNIVRDDDDEL